MIINRDKSLLRFYLSTNPLLNTIMSQSDIKSTNYCYTTILALRSSCIFSDTYSPTNRGKTIPAMFSRRACPIEEIYLRQDKSMFLISVANFTVQFSLTFLSFETETTFA